MAKNYILNDFKNLKQMNIYYKSIKGIYSYKDEYAVLIDDTHLCIVPNSEEATKLVRSINLNIALKYIEYYEAKKSIKPKITFADLNYEQVNVSLVGEALFCNLIMPKDIRIDGMQLVPTKRLLKQFYAKAVKKGKRYEALDFNFEELEPQLINEVATVVLGISRPTSSQIASFKNYEERYVGAVTDFLEFEENKLSQNKDYKINNDFVDCILQVEKAFKEIRPLRKNVVLHKSANGVLKNYKVGDIISRTSYISTSLVEKKENYKNIVYYHIVVPRGTPFSLVSQASSEEIELENENGILIPPSKFEVKFVEKDAKNRKTDIKLKFANELDIRHILQKAFQENCESYVRSNSNGKKSRDQYDKCRTKYKSFFDENNDQLDLIEQINKLNDSSLNYLLEEIEDINFDKDLFENEGEDDILHTKRMMLLSSIFSKLENISQEEERILITASKYHDIGLNTSEDNKGHGRLASQKLTNELEEFDEAQKDIIRFLIAEHDLSNKEIEKDLANVTSSKKARFEKLLICFRDLLELENIRLYKFNPTKLVTKSSKKMIKIAFDNWSLFDTLFSYLSAESFAMSRLEDIKTIAEISGEEEESKKGFALVNVVNSKSSLLSKTIGFFDKLKQKIMQDNTEEKSAAAAKARLSKVMVGRQIARRQEKSKK